MRRKKLSYRKRGLEPDVERSYCEFSKIKPSRRAKTRRADALRSEKIDRVA
jgi:hypothetical protein